MSSKKRKVQRPERAPSAAEVRPDGPPPASPAEPPVPPPPAQPPGAEPAPAPADAEGPAAAPADHIEVVPFASDEADELRKAFAALEHDFLRLKQEHSEIKDKYLRKLAEMDNLRKRVEREKADFQSFALNGVLRDILVVVDNFARALSGPGVQEGGGFREGMELIHRQLVDFLAKNGVTPIEAAGRAFDPALHQAFASEEADDVAEPTVAEEMQKGYLLHGRLLRPALVKVRVPKKGE
jgi:molecular chaperone GrpE